MAADPIHQFQIQNLVPLFKIGSADIHFTNSALFMIVSVVLSALLLIGTTAGRRLVPTRLQSMAELTYELVGSTLRNAAGEEGMKFFPLVFSLFMFILISNVVGLIPYTFTVTSHIIITVALALTVFFTVIVYGIWKQRPALLQAVRAERHSGLDAAADRLHRDAVVPVAADLAQRASVRQHAGRPHHAASSSAASSS